MNAHWRHWMAICIVVMVACPVFAQGQVAAPPPPPPPPPGMRPYAPPPPPAPRLVLSAWGGWATSSDVNGYSTTLQIGDATSWGAAVGVRIPNGLLAELKWIYMNPDVQALGYGSAAKFSVPTHYLLLSGEKGFGQGRVEPFLYGALGTVVFVPESFTLAGTRYSPSSTWRMAFGLGGGIRVHLTQRLGLRFCAEMLAPLYLSGGSFYVGTGGAGVGVSGVIPTVTGNFTAGLTLAF